MNRIIVLSITIFIGWQSTFAEKAVYLGADVYYSSWNVGLLHKRTISTDTITQKNSSTRRDLLMVGASATFALKRRFFFSYAGAFGFNLNEDKYNVTNKINFAVSDCSGTACTGTYSADTELNNTLKVKRHDHNVAFSYLFGRTGIGAFVGGKLQFYQARVNAGDGFNSQVIDVTSPIVTQIPDTNSYNASGKLTTDAYGPAFGLSYTRPIKSWFHASLQASYMVLWGISNNQSSTVSTTGTLSANTTLVKEKFIGHGFSGIITFMRIINHNYMLHLSYRLQFYQMNSLSSNLTLTDDIKGTQLLTNSDSFVDGAQDIFHGVSLGVIAKVF